MAKPKGKSSAKGGGGKTKGGFLAAFVATVALVAVVAMAWDAYGLDGYSPSFAVSGWPMVGALVLVGACGLAYWRGGKPALWGVVAATCGAALVLAWLTDSLPRP
ncbi:MAG: hypothetical protein QOE90_3636 [Thermoplasmata archaeon]|jgi:hypothetical protein|nr:hypothetical protein [Thermoplasmata archaeon]